MHLFFRIPVIIIDEKEMLLKEMRASGREIILLTLDEIKGFAGNCFELQTRSEELVLAISHTATSSLNAENLAALQRHFRFLEVDVPTIEQFGGGGVLTIFHNLFFLIYKLSTDTLYDGWYTLTNASKVRPYLQTDVPSSTRVWKLISGTIYSISLYSKVSNKRINPLAHLFCAKFPPYPFFFGF